MKWIVLSLVACALAGCSGPSSAPNAGSNSPTQGDASAALSSVEPSGSASPNGLGCANQAVLTRDLEGAPTTPGDIDADGFEESIAIGRDPGGPHGCQALLSVSGEGLGSLLAMVEGEFNFDLGLPRILGTAEIDGAPPQEIIIDVAAGASTAFSAVFSVLDGELVRRVVEGDSPYSNLFPYGGSVGHIEGVDCADAGRIVIASALPKGDGYVVQRRFFQATGGAAFVLDEDATETSKVAVDDLARVSEFGGAPFANCPQ